MRLDDALFFNSGRKWSEISPDDIENLIDEYEIRIRGFYLHPSFQLLENTEVHNCKSNGFAIGILLLTAIDAIGTFFPNRKTKDHYEDSFTEFIKDDEEYKQLSSEEKDKISKIMANEFRNGLIHNGRIKNGCEFSFETPNMFHLVKNTLIVNPKKFHACVDRNISRFFLKIKKDEGLKKLFKSEFTRIYASELEEYKS